jgi:hypothetical protein
VTLQKLVSSSTIAFALLALAPSVHADILDLEMTGPEYQRYFDANKEVGNRASAAINKIIDVGARNLEWFKLINAHRPADAQLALYTPELQVGIPMDKPREYNEKTVLADYKALTDAMPENYKSVLLGNAALPTTHPMASDDEYLEWARKTDRVYQIASRWSLMEPNLSGLAARSTGDIRGYYFLGKVDGLQSLLNNWEAIPEADKTNYTTWLILVCHNNNKDKSKCKTELNQAINNNSVNAYYTKYLPASKVRYDSYFNLQNPRSDVVWNSQNPQTMFVPFATPQSAEVKKWLADNIEDEWTWADWHLRLNFIHGTFGTTAVEFEAGATPHVNGLGGSQITMDANAPLQDYGSRWTIRHEYGHTLGFPDCYVEFYDTEREIITNYQLDLDNIMCSRRGHIQARHYNDLKAKYYH